MDHSPYSYAGHAGAPPRYRLLSVAVAAFLLGGTLPALAQEEEQEEEKSAFLEDLIVTAQRREDTIQDVPFSIGAHSGEDLIELGAESVEDIARNIASFSIQNLGPGQSQVAIRGVSAGQIVRDQPGLKEQVGIYLDDSVISMSLFTPDLELVDLERVEVLRGPQGTLFGSGSLSGTVRYITKQPTLGFREAAFTAEGNLVDEDDFGGSMQGIMNMPMGDRSALRTAVYYRRFGGFIDAVQPDGSIDDNVNSGRRYGARVSARFEPNDSLVITPRLVYQEVEMDGFARRDVFNILANPFTTTRPPVDLGSQQQFTQFEEQFTDEFLLFDLNVEYNFGNGLSLTSISSYTDRDILQVRDATALTGSITGGSIGLPEPVYTLDAPLLDHTQLEMFTQEVRLTNDPESRLRWVGGFFYSSIEREYGQDLLVSGFEDMTGIPTAGPMAPKDVLFFSRIPYDFEQSALFGEATFAMTDKLDVTAGLRYFDFSEDRVLNFDGIFADTTIGEPGSTSTSGYSPRIMLNYAVSDNFNLNAQASKGFRLGGINDPLNVPLCSPQDLVTFGDRDSFDDETLWNYEIGAKSTFMDGRARLNAAVFYMDIEDLQATVTAGTCSSRLVFNVPKSRVQGLDLEFTVKPNQNVDFSFSGTYADSELRSTITSVDEQGNESVVEGIQSGNRLPTTPKLELNASASYNWNLDNGWQGFVTGSVQYVGSRYTQIGDQAEGFGTVPIRDGLGFNIGDIEQENFTFNPELPAYEIGNIRIGVRAPQFELSLFVNNILDEQALLSVDQERGRLARVGFLVNQPRTVGVTYRHFFNM